MHRRAFLLLATGVAIASPAFGQQRAQPFWTDEWPRTDFARASVDFAEIISGGVPRDGIPALASVRFTKAGAINISSNEPVITVAIEDGPERAYPVRYLMWHEIANDVIGETPVAVTYCPLCNSAVVFDRRVQGRVLSFGVSGKLRHSDMVMFDRETESWWQQFTGEAIVGSLTGAKLGQIVNWMEPLAEFVARNPGGMVMREPDGEARAYGNNPYGGYDSSDHPFLYSGENPPHSIPPLARVVRVGNRAWPLSRLSKIGEITEAGLRIVWQQGMASPLDKTTIANSRDIGSIRVFDMASGQDVIHDVVFAFAFHAFEPDGEWMLGN